MKIARPIRNTFLRPIRSPSRPDMQQEPGERHEVGVDHPREAGLREVEVVLDLRQRDVHDRRVERVHQHREADDDQRQPAPPVRVLGRSRRGRHGAHCNGRDVPPRDAPKSFRSGQAPLPAGPATRVAHAAGGTLSRTRSAACAPMRRAGRASTLDACACIRSDRWSAPPPSRCSAGPCCAGRSSPTGATREEADARLPGDELLEDADGVSTRAIDDRRARGRRLAVARADGTGAARRCVHLRLDREPARPRHAQRRSRPAEFQHPRLGDEIAFGRNRMRLERVEPRARARMALRGRQLGVDVRARGARRAHAADQPQPLPAADARRAHRDGADGARLARHGAQDAARHQASAPSGSRPLGDHPGPAGSPRFGSRRSENPHSANPTIAAALAPAAVAIMPALGTVSSKKLRVAGISERDHVQPAERGAHRRDERRAPPRALGLERHHEVEAADHEDRHRDGARVGHREVEVVRARTGSRRRRRRRAPRRPAPRSARRRARSCSGRHGPLLGASARKNVGMPIVMRRREREVARQQRVGVGARADRQDQERGERRLRDVELGHPLQVAQRPAPLGDERRDAREVAARSARGRTTLRAICVPLPWAIARRALFSAGTSLTPSPTIAT